MELLNCWSIRCCWRWTYFPRNYKTNNISVPILLYYGPRSMHCVDWYTYLPTPRTLQHPFRRICVPSWHKPVLDSSGAYICKSLKQCRILNSINLLPSSQSIDIHTDWANHPRILFSRLTWLVPVTIEYVLHVLLYTKHAFPCNSCLYPDPRPDVSLISPAQYHQLLWLLLSQHNPLLLLQFILLQKYINWCTVNTHH